MSLVCQSSSAGLGVLLAEGEVGLGLRTEERGLGVGEGGGVIEVMGWEMEVGEGDVGEDGVGEWVVELVEMREGEEMLADDGDGDGRNVDAVGGNMDLGGGGTVFLEAGQGLVVGMRFGKMGLSVEEVDGVREMGEGDAWLLPAGPSVLGGSEGVGIVLLKWKVREVDWKVVLEGFSW
ncbi:MAG: hypothetical protein LQ343_007032 [Gyalolechia ehrenbergii]|nr:MAG: hypothetical protein LQ343_007032 [Gyalolechia ehrenbergii]